MNGPTIAESGSLTLGTLIWLPVLALLVIAAVIAAALLRRLAADADTIDETFLRWSARLVLALGVGLVIATLLPGIGMYPYAAEYHQWRDVTGTVQKIDERIISGSDGGPNTKFVVRFEGSALQFGCDDTRCASVESGDQLALSCKRAWQYTGTDGYDCRFTSTEAPA